MRQANRDHLPVAQAVLDGSLFAGGVSLDTFSVSEPF
jgi:hypothetical protein